MADTKTPFYVTLVTGAALVLQLDADIYGVAAIQTATGITSTKPATGKFIPLNRRYALLSKAVLPLSIRVSRGTGEGKKYRRIAILVETSKIDTAAEELSGKIMNLGNGAGVAWTIE